MLGPTLRDFDTSEVTTAADAYRVRGMETKAADITAIEDHLRDLSQQRKTMEATILAEWKKRDPDGYAAKAIAPKAADKMDAAQDSAPAGKKAYDENVTKEDNYGQRKVDIRPSGPDRTKQKLATTVGGEPAAEGWVGATRISGKDGQPTILRRGADRPLESKHFSREALGKASGHPSSGLGVWFTDGQTEARRFGNVESFYLDIRNPKIIKAEELPGFDSVEDANAYQAKLKAAGYDGIVITAAHLGKQEKHVVAFDPKQVIIATSYRQGEQPASETDTDGRVAEPSAPGYIDPYDKLETRPGTKPEQLEAGRSSLADVEKRIFGSNRSSLRGSATILGSNIPSDFREKGYTTLIGQKVESSHDLALISQVLRDPRFETFRVFFVKAGKIVGERAYTSRLPAAVSIPGDLVELVSADMGRTGADGYWLLHNHPAGYAKASKVDMRLTEYLASKAKGMLGHVIIDRNEYNSITIESSPFSSNVLAEQNIIKADLGAIAAAPEVPHAILGKTITAPADFAAIAKNLQADGVYSSIIGTGGELGAVTMVLDVPDMSSKSGMDRLRAGAAIRRAARETHSQRLFAVVPGELSDYMHLMGSRLFTDIISQSTGKSASNLGMLLETKEGTKSENRGLLLYVAEPTAPDYVQARTKIGGYPVTGLGDRNVESLAPNLSPRPNTNLADAARASQKDPASFVSRRQELSWARPFREAPLGAQGQNPDLASVVQKARDSGNRILTEEDVVKEYGPSFSRANQAPAGIGSPQARQLLKPILPHLRIGVTVFDTVVEAREKLGIKSIKANAAGIYNNGKAYIIAENIRDEADLYETLFHELFHVGFRASFKGDISGYTNALRIVALRNGNIRDAAGVWRTNFGADAHAM